MNQTMEIPLEPSSRQYSLTHAEQSSIEQRCIEHYRNDTRSKIRYAIISAIVFAIVSSPFLYRIVESLLGKIMTVAVDGCPTMLGLLLHSVVFALIIYTLMELEI
jgi:hypothetical protein